MGFPENGEIDELIEGLPNSCRHRDLHRSGRLDHDIAPSSLRYQR
jgi:hypothetical protein